MNKQTARKPAGQAKVTASVLGIVLVLALSTAPAAAATTITNGDLVYDRNPNGGGESEREIYRSESDGSGEIQLTSTVGENQAPEWSPDGTEIAFYSDRGGNNDIYKMNENGGNQTNLTNNAGADIFPAWSPNGAKIAFNSDRNGGNNGFWTMGSDGSSPVQLSDPSVDFTEAGLLWSPDGSTILASSTGIISFSATGTNQTGTLLIAGYYATSWSPDGLKLLAVSTSNSQFYTLNSDGTGLTQLTFDATVKNWGDYSPDGTRIAYTAFAGGSPYNLWVMNVNGTGQTQLTFSTTVNYFFVDWQPIITITPNPALDNGSQAATASVTELDTLPAAGPEAAGFAAAVAGLAAVRYGKKRR